MAGRVDQVQLVGLAVGGGVGHAHGARLDGDALLALQVHRVEHLLDHLALATVPVSCKQPVGQRGLAVVDMGDDAEIANVFLVSHSGANILFDEQIRLQHLSIGLRPPFVKASAGIKRGPPHQGWPVFIGNAPR